MKRNELFAAVTKYYTDLAACIEFGSNSECLLAISFLQSTLSVLKSDLQRQSLTFRQFPLVLMLSIFSYQTKTEFQRNNEVCKDWQKMGQSAPAQKTFDTIPPTVLHYSNLESPSPYSRWLPGSPVLSPNQTEIYACNLHNNDVLVLDLQGKQTHTLKEKNPNLSFFLPGCLAFRDPACLVVGDQGRIQIIEKDRGGHFQITHTWELKKIVGAVCVDSKLYVLHKGGDEITLYSENWVSLRDYTNFPLAFGHIQAYNSEILLVGHQSDTIYKLEFNGEVSVKARVECKFLIALSTSQHHIVVVARNNNDHIVFQVLKEEGISQRLKLLGVDRKYFQERRNTPTGLLISSRLAILSLASERIMVFKLG